MRKRPRNPIQGPFPGESDEAHYQVEDLEDRNGFHGAVEILRHEVPEQFGPNEALDCASYLDWILQHVSMSSGLRVVGVDCLTGCCCEDNQSCPVVLD